MTPRSTVSDRSPVGVNQFDDCSTICTQETKLKGLVRTQGKLRGPGESKSIRFSERNETFEIPHLDDWPDEDIDAVWYSPEDYSQIKTAYQATIFLMESGKNLDSDPEHETRGLEYRTQEGSWERYQNKRDVYNAVLDEQDRQWKVDQDDFEKIREIYLSHSNKCTQAAVMRGKNDEKVAQSYLSSFRLQLKVSL